MAIKDELLDQLLEGYQKPEDLLGEDGIFQELKKALVEKALGAELPHHLGYEKGQKPSRAASNTRNGHGKKKVKGQDGEMEIAVPRDRDGTFEPQLIKKGQRRFEGFDDKIISLYARGMTVREIQGHLKQLYAVEGVREWQNRPLDPVYPLVIFDALRVKIRDEGMVKNKAVYLALGMNVAGFALSLTWSLCYFRLEGAFAGLDLDLLGPKMLGIYISNFTIKAVILALTVACLADAFQRGKGGGGKAEQDCDRPGGNL